MGEHRLGGGSLIGVPVKHQEEEVSKGLRLVLLEAVLLAEDLLQGPVAEASDAPQVSRLIKVALVEAATQRDIAGHAPKQLHHLRQVVIVLAVVLAFAGLKEEVTRCHLKHHARQRPHIRRGTVLAADDYFWRAILPGLNGSGEMVIGPAAIAEITYLQPQVLIELGSSPLGLLLFKLLLNCDRVEVLEVQARHTGRLAT